MKRKHRLLTLLLSGLLTVNVCGCSMQAKDDSSGSEKTETEESDGANDEKDKGDKEEKKERRPQNNFYDYINYDKLSELEIPYGEAAASYFAGEEIQDVIEDMIVEIGSSDESFADGTNEQLVHDIYRQALEYKENDKIVKAIMGNCDRILAAKDIQELFKIWGDLCVNHGAQSIFNFNINRDYKDGTRYCIELYGADNFLGTELKDIKDLSKNCTEANNIARDMHRVMGDDYETADEKGKQMVYLAIDIANATDTESEMTLEKMLDTPKTSFADLDSIMSNLDGSLVEMFLGDAVSRTDGVYIYDPDQLKAINDLITDENLEKWRSYIFTGYLQEMGAYIPESNSILRDYNPESKEKDEKLAALVVQNYLSTAISELYAERYYTPELDKGIHDLFDEIIDSYDDLISKADWLTADTRKALIKKLHGIKLLTTPTPHKVDPKDAGLIGADLYESAINMKKKIRNDKIAKLDKKVSLDEVDMSAAEFNAQYLPSNCINITVAIMQKPMFDPKGDNAENLGALGSVVGHEIGHAFDSTCINYNADGKYDPDWINDTDKQVLKERADALTEYYSKFTIMEVYHVDGKLTNGENYADLSGIECVTNIVDDEEELKKLFKSYAQSWCTLAVDSEAISALKLDPHSPAKVRVNAVLASNKKFNEVYDLKEGDGMYVAPEERVSRW
ncbi:M13 family metallopeptidase [Ruminococcus sp.]|uniref:M13 family metallopeptidase n=1 Tax=Ruminococcus sp. TaxID=41978 RepID=UPI0025D4DEFC|nr:M13 family metallopeptidase [Ruminococcus sp.]MCR4638174.1 M13 family metallopeptidase [Ruminococcus sp.]